jgi:hypothetical protein
MSGDIQERRNWTGSLTIVVVVAVAAAIIGSLVGVEAEKTERLYFKNTAGAVLFDHESHSQAAASCAACHHELYSSALSTECKSCHGEGFDPEDFKHSELKEIHNRDCGQCHQVRDEEVHGTSCRECHPGAQQTETTTLSCTACHDDDYSPEMLSHDEYLEIEDHSCLGCHQPQSVSTVYHTNCSHCHLETSPEKFAQADGEVRCGACHLR